MLRISDTATMSWLTARGFCCTNAVERPVVSLDATAVMESAAGRTRTEVVAVSLEPRLSVAVATQVTL